MLFRSQGKVVEFMYMPEGVKRIFPTVDGKTHELHVKVDASTAKSAQASLQSLYSVRPNLDPYGCVEHHEEEASVRLPKGVANFSYKEGEGVFLAAEPTELGAKNVNGKMHRGWSPSFLTDADYSKAVEKDGVMVFPAKARGGKDNPAEVTGIAYCVGTLTNKPAFRDIAPVKAKEGEAVVQAAGGNEDGHPFWGNQWTDENTGTADEKKADEVVKRLNGSDFGDSNFRAEHKGGGKISIKTSQYFHSPSHVSDVEKDWGTPTGTHGKFFAEEHGAAMKYVGTESKENRAKGWTHTHMFSVHGVKSESTKASEINPLEEAIKAAEAKAISTESAVKAAELKVLDRKSTCLNSSH